MTLWRIIGLGIMAAGIVLLVIGINATDTFGEEVRQELTGEYSDETLWYIIGGVAAIVIGGGLTIFGGGRSKKA